MSAEEKDRYQKREKKKFEKSLICKKEKKKKLIVKILINKKIEKTRPSRNTNLDPIILTVSTVSAPFDRPRDLLLNDINHGRRDGTVSINSPNFYPRQTRKCTASKYEPGARFTR